VAGAEVTAFWTVNDAVQLSGNFTRLHMQLRARTGSSGENAAAAEGKNAENLVYVRAYVDLPRDVHVAGEVRYVGAIPGEEIGGYVDGNINVSRTIVESLRLNITLDNLMHRRHAEWNGGGLVQSRSLRAGVKWTF
jgi:hypothetical protein